MCAGAGLLCKLDMDLEVITAALWTLLIRRKIGAYVCALILDQRPVG